MEALRVVCCMLCWCCAANGDGRGMSARLLTEAAGITWGRVLLAKVWEAIAGSSLLWVEFVDRYTHAIGTRPVDLAS